VLTEAPRPILPQRHTIPPEVEGAVLTALEKLPADRFASAAEFAQALAGRGTGGSMARTAATAARTAAPAARPRLDPVKLGLFAALAVAAGLAGWGWLRSGPAPAVNRFSLYLPPDEALLGVTGSGNRLAISPDGLRLVYIGPGPNNGRLWVRDHDKLGSTPISGTDGAGSPFFSPDGRSVGFILSGTRLRTVPLDGGPTQSLSDSVNATAADWGSDGYIYVECDSGIGRVRATGGPLELVYRIAPHNQAGAEWPVVLPGAKGLVFRTRLANQATSDFNIVGMTLPNGQPHVLTRGILARYSPTGHLLVLTADGKLVGMPFDAGKVAVTGPPVGLLEGIGIEVGGFSANVALSNTGTLIYTTGAAARARRPAWVTREGLEIGIDSTWEPQGTIGAAAISPDGRSLAVDLTQNGNSSIWIKQLPVGPFSRLTFGDTSNLRPAWTPDGRSLIYIGNVSAPGGMVMRRRADGTGSAEVLIHSPFMWAQALPSPDGRWILARRSVQEAGNGDIFGVRAGDSALVPLVTGPATEALPAVSPDGRWLAYATTESGTVQVYVRPFPDVSSARWQVSTGDGRDPRWSHSGRELFYVSPSTGKLMSVAVKPGATFAFDQPRALFSTVPYVPGGSVPAYDVGPDDKRFLFLRETAPNQRSELIMVQNWSRELKERSRK
jgi:eukaryotic-like serine/threonine-protein kinase